MIEYLAKAAGAWFLGFFPLFEIYVAVPAALAMGLGPVSAVFWCVLGNLTPVPLILFGYGMLLRVPRLGPWMHQLGSGRAQRALERYGGPILLLATPWIGIWATAAAARTMGMPNGRLIVYTSASVIAYAVGLTIMIGLGVNLVTGSEAL